MTSSANTVSPRGMVVTTNLVLCTISTCSPPSPAVLSVSPVKIAGILWVITAFPVRIRIIPDESAAMCALRRTSTASIRSIPTEWSKTRPVSKSNVVFQNNNNNQKRENKRLHRRITKFIQFFHNIHTYIYAISRTYVLAVFRRPSHPRGVLSNIQNTGFKKNAFQNFKDPIQPELIRIQLGSRFSISCGFDHMLKKVSHSLFLPVYVFHRHFLYISILIINDDRATFKPTTNTIKFWYVLTVG